MLAPKMRASAVALADTSHPDGPDPTRGDFPGAFAWAVAQVTSESARLETVAAQAAPPGAAALDAVKQQESAGAPTWGCVDLTAILAGDIVQAEPMLFTRDDGQSLLYPGLTHSFHGESESGKSLILQAEAARQVSLGNRVLYIDYESDAVSVVGRLRTFAARRQILRRISTTVALRRVPSGVSNSLRGTRCWIRATPLPSLTASRRDWGCSVTPR